MCRSAETLTWGVTTPGGKQDRESLRSKECVMDWNLVLLIGIVVVMVGLIRASGGFGRG